MLPRRHRLVRQRDFSHALRGGGRGGSRRVVVHVSLSGEEQPALVGFAVGRSVGNSVVRHRVIRQLRHLMIARVDRLPGGSRVVVRATPEATGARSSVLAGDLDKALVTALTRARARAGTR